MIAILTEKPAAAMLIAHVVGANEKCDGFMQGGGYAVTWTFGQPVQLAPAASYGRKCSAELPLIPETFKLATTSKRQVGVVRRVLAQCEEVITTADFHDLLNHLKCEKPVRRLCLTALTEDAIYKGMSRLRDNKEFALHRAATECRAKADWLVGTNASAAFKQPLNRLSTPILAMIASRYLAHKNFLPTDLWTTSVTLSKDGAFHKFQHEGDVGEVLKTATKAVVMRVERKQQHDQPPQLLDLTALQIECAERHGMSAEQTIHAAQSLYEKGMTTHPVDPTDHAAHEIPSLLRMILRMEQFADRTLDTQRLPRRNLDAAILLTGNYVREPLTANEQRVYDAICGRMLDAFAPRVERQAVLVEVAIGALTFCATLAETDLAEGEVLPIVGHSLARRKTQPPPLYTEATLLAALTESGFAIPTSRSATIETLIKDGHIERFDGVLTPTQRGLKLYRAVKDLRIADAELAAHWEQSLRSVASGAMRPDTFMRAIEIYTRQVTAELISLGIEQPPEERIPCPKCGCGTMVLRHRLARCTACDLTVPRRFLNKELTDLQLTALLKTGRTPLVKGFLGNRARRADELTDRAPNVARRAVQASCAGGNADTTFATHLALDKNFNITFHEP